MAPWGIPSARAVGVQERQHSPREKLAAEKAGFILSWHHFALFLFFFPPPAVREDAEDLLSISEIP